MLNHHERVNTCLVTGESDGGKSHVQFRLPNVSRFSDSDVPLARSRSGGLHLRSRPIQCPVIRQVLQLGGCFEFGSVLEDKSYDSLFAAKILFIPIENFG